MTVRRISRVWRVFAVALATAVVLGALRPSPAAAVTAEPSFFNTKEIKSTNMKPFKKWTAAVARYQEEKAKAGKIAGDCKAQVFNRCHYERWLKFLISLKGKSKAEQVKAVNDFMNKAKYITDQSNWGQKDYWEAPGEFIARFGDCEDYAIAKFMSLALLGFTDDEMRIVAVKDLNLKVGHAILIVFLDGKPYVLDNQIKQVIAADKVHHYQPVYSINMTAWWRHRS